MTTFSRRLAGVELPRAAAIMLGLLLVLGLAAYVFSVVTYQPTAGGVVAALSLVAVAGSGLLYAWRPGAGGLAD